MNSRHIAALTLSCMLLPVAAAVADEKNWRAIESDPVSPQVERMYLKGIRFLVQSQGKSGNWPDTSRQPGVTGLAVLAILAHGDDPNHGPYAKTVQRGLDVILKQQNGNGYIGNSMYHHGFATLALAEAYGTVDDDRLGPALESAVGLSLAAQGRNGRGAWRYNPNANDGDTTVAGAVLVSLLAARNAGIEVPQSAITQALNFFASCQSRDGGFGYTGPSGSNTVRSSIGNLVFSLARKTDSTPYRTSKVYLSNKSHGQGASGRFHYYLYYASQAYFRMDSESWNGWNAANIRVLSTTQATDGSWAGRPGKTFSTSTALLSLALNYRLLPIYER